MSDDKPVYSHYGPGRPVKSELCPTRLQRLAEDILELRWAELVALGQCIRCDAKTLYDWAHANKPESYTSADQETVIAVAKPKPGLVR